VAGRIRSNEKSNDLIGNRTRSLPACSCVSTNYAASYSPPPPSNNSTERYVTPFHVDLLWDCRESSYVLLSPVMDNQADMHVIIDPGGISSSSSETSINLLLITRRHVPEDSKYSALPVLVYLQGSVSRAICGHSPNISYSIRISRQTLRNRYFTSSSNNDKFLLSVA
jgi:hypothetical protein